jgi:hypothetical protein
LCEAVEEYRATCCLPGVALNLAGLAAVLIQHQDLARAARLLSAAEAQWELVVGSWWASADRAAYDRNVALVRAPRRGDLGDGMGRWPRDDTGASAYRGIGPLNH